MKPFKFFFGLSLAIIFFFFIARFVVLALIGAIIFSILFAIGRKVKNFFRNLSWENRGAYDYRLQRAYHQQYDQLPMWQEQFSLQQEREKAYQFSESTYNRTIKIQ